MVPGTGTTTGHRGPSPPGARRRPRHRTPSNRRTPPHPRTTPPVLAPRGRHRPPGGPQTELLQGGPPAGRGRRRVIAVVAGLAVVVGVALLAMALVGGGLFRPGDGQPSEADSPPGLSAPPQDTPDGPSG